LKSSMESSMEGTCVSINTQTQKDVNEQVNLKKFIFMVVRCQYATNVYQQTLAFVV
jgi:hypothetical protein